MTVPADRVAPSDTNAAQLFAVVTGASSGIGLELAKQLAERGHDLLIVAEDEQIEQASSQISATGARVEALVADLRTDDGINALIDRVTSSNRDVDVLCLNAGVGLGGAFIEQDVDRILSIIDLNIRSTVLTSRHLLPKMVAAGHGRVLYTASIAAEIPGTFQAVYNASKAFDLSFSEALRNELKDTGVSITALQPGATDTEFFERADLLDTKVGQSKKDDPADVARAGLEALFAGKDKVVSGFKNKVQSAMASITPDPMLAEQHRKMAEPGSGSK